MFSKHNIYDEILQQYMLRKCKENPTSVKYGVINRFIKLELLLIDQLFAIPKFGMESQKIVFNNNLN